MLLLFPPQAPPFSPHLAVYQLKGYLKSRSVDTDAIDLNILLYNQILHIFKLNYGIGLVSKDSVFSYLKNPIYFYNREHYKQAISAMLFAFNVMKRQLSFEIRLLGINYGINVSSSKRIYSHIKTSCDWLYDFYRQVLNDKLDSYNVIGISICYESQLIPALALCRYIKMTFPTAKIVIGGSHASIIAQELNDSILSELFDKIIVGTGEAALYTYIRQFKTRDTVNAPDIYESNNIITTNIKSATANMIVEADWSDVDFRKYFSPEPIISILISHGCYWGKCRFCNHEMLYSGLYAIATPAEVAGYLLKMNANNGFKYFSFCDSVIPLVWLKEFAERIKGTSIVWEACVRFEDNFSDFCTLQKGGCRLLRFGLESGSHVVLKTMNKGITLQNASRILQMSFNADICNFIYIFAGYPGETYADAQETINFIEKNKYYISFASGGGEFYLAKGSILHNFPEKFSIKLFKNIEDDLSISFPYIDNSGITKNVITEMATMQRQSLRKLCHSESNMIDGIYDSHDFLYAAKYGSHRIREAR